MKKIACVDFEKLDAKIDSTILDLGCGRGQVLIPLAERGYEVIGVDLNSTSFNTIRADCKRKYCKLEPWLLIANGKGLPFASNVFDIVVCREVLEHVEHPDKILAEIYRVLRPKAHLLISVPSKHTECYFQFINPRWLEMAGHVQVFPRKELKALLEKSGFDVIEIHGGNFFYTFFWFFHSIVRTKHDGTGRILEHPKLANIIFRVWEKLGHGRVKWGIERIGNLLFPRSYFYYSIKLKKE